MAVSFLCIQEMAGGSDMLAFSRLYFNGKCFFLNCLFICVDDIHETIFKPNNNIYESIGIFCPASRIELVDLLETEDVLLNWTKVMYLNFTHTAIMNRLDSFYDANIGHMERLDGDIYVLNKLDDKNLEVEK